MQHGCGERRTSTCFSGAVVFAGDGLHRHPRNRNPPCHAGTPFTLGNAMRGVIDEGTLQALR